jgi:transcriptional regulator with XRE-family HTH domain
VRGSAEVTIADAARFGKWFRERRKRLGYSQAKIETFGIVVRSAVSMLENGKMLISTDTALELGRALGASDLEVAAVIGVAELVAVLLRERE